MLPDTVAITAVAVGCRFCAHRAVFDGDDCVSRVEEWALPHPRPYVIAVRHELDGVDHGWTVR